MTTPNEVNINEIMEKATFSSAIFNQLDQKHVDRIVKAVYEAGFNARIKLAKMAAEETKIGKWEDKVIKNVVATQFVYEDIKNLKTVGVISENDQTGIIEIAQPLGPVLAVTPVTNPTSTVLFKILIALKSRNPIIIRPHSSAVDCSCEAARICYEAALKEDAPEDCIQWIKSTTREQTRELMSHKKLAIILATGGGGLVKAAYSSGKPALGVGAGNVPVYIEQSADVKFAIDQIFLSKTFDNGTICASEQAMVVDKDISEQVISELKQKNAYFLSQEEIKKLEPIAYNFEKQVMNADIIGQPVSVIAKAAGLNIPDSTTLLIAPLKGIGDDYPLSSEILAPVLAFYIADDFDAAVNLCIDLNFHGGVGHTVSMFSNDQEKILNFSTVMNAGRIVINTPSSQGAVGGIYNTLPPSLTLGCGTGGGNITTDNITATHLLNIQRIAKRRLNMRFETFDTSKYFNESLDAKTIEKEFNLNY
ncbi:aldehyde dehydrogenase family protein [Candidatus Margulisiibacteriota bacterium]